MSIGTAALRSVTDTRYVTPLREGGSLPGLMEADDDGLYVTKFRGAGQGLRALIAEVIVGELARRLRLLVPELVEIEVDAAFGAAEPDPEIQELITASAGSNLGVDFLPGALPYVPGGAWEPDPGLAAEIVWLDALTTNVDRTPRNPNMLLWHGRLWLIDHGAALYLHHGGLDAAEHASRPFPLIAQVERGERFNAGVVLFCRQRDFLGIHVALDERRLDALAPGAPAAEVRSHLDALVWVAEGDPGGGPIAAMPPWERFGWLVAPSSTIVQPSEVHTGLSENPAATLEALFTELVGP